MTFDLQDARASEAAGIGSVEHARPMGAESPVAPPAAFRWWSLVAGVVGGVLTGCGIAASIGTIAPASQPQELQVIAAEDVETAAQSLIAGKAADLAEGARSCRQPLGFLVVQANGVPAGTIRFRSGDYVSPRLKLEGAPERIALPFPAPYATGHGQIIVENLSGGADVFLTPGARLTAGPGNVILNVHWTPKPC